MLVAAAWDNPLRARVRVSVDGSLRYDGPLPADLSSLRATVDPRPVDGGTSQPAAASQVADILARTTGLSNQDADYRVLWSAAIPMAGLDDSTTAIIATVQAVTPDGGGPFATYAFDPGQPDASARNHPTGSGISGDPAHSVIAMRLPRYTGSGPTDALQIIAPPDAVTAKVFTYNGSDPTTVPLDRGSGQGHLPMGIEATVVAFNADGKEVARCSFVDHEDNIVDLYEPPVHQ